ncbi:MAG: hypothetical protein WC505_06925 [Patescibacteria group bacterium]
MPTFARIDAKSATVSHHLRAARQVILNSLPRPSDRAVNKVLERLTQAYQTLPLHRLTLLMQVIETAPRIKRAESMRNVYQQLDNILLDLGHCTKTPDQDDAILAFMKAVSTKGWKTQELNERETQQDGFKQSQDYIDTIAVDADELLQTEFGVISVPIVLLQGYSIPKQALNDWSQEPYNLDIAVVFGRYITLSPVPCIGIAKKLVEIHRDKETIVDMTKFFRMARELKAEMPIPFPRLVGGHYYCPVWTERDEARRFLRQWDLLLR